ncbi:MAG TPA: NADH-quinone oxidoreductase subunit J [Thermomicrobiales bacterium]|nr:NADH-quinone oxidoreductase subunit J [Thermomicrobiales bacterium]
MSAEVLVFDILAVIAVIAGIGVVVSRNPVHSAVALVVTFINLAGIFVMLRAEFLAAAQVIVYTGAILVLVLFVIMLVDMDDLPDFRSGAPLQRITALAIGLIMLGEVAAAILTRTVVGQPGPWNEETVAAAGGNVQVLGQFLYSGYVLPVQVVAVVLLVGTIGALVMARPDEMGARPIARTTGTISLGHPRGADIVALPSGAPATWVINREDMRDGLVMVTSADAYTEHPAWAGGDVVPPDTARARSAMSEFPTGVGIGSEENS